MAAHCGWRYPEECSRFPFPLVMGVMVLAGGSPDYAEVKERGTCVFMAVRRALLGTQGARKWTELKSTSPACCLVINRCHFVMTPSWNRMVTFTCVCVWVGVDVHIQIIYLYVMILPTCIGIASPKKGRGDIRKEALPRNTEPV